MAGYLTASFYGASVFMLDYTEGTIPASASADDRLDGMRTWTLGTTSKETNSYRTLDGDGWEAVVTLGNSQEEATFDCIRLGLDGVYSEDGTDTYSRIKAWFMSATANGGKASPKTFVEVIPRGDKFEGTVYNVVPTEWAPGERTTDEGQLYSFTVKPFGPPIPVNVEYSDGTWTFTDPKAAA